MVISPDGMTVVFVARDDKGSASLMARRLDRLETIELIGTKVADLYNFEGFPHYDVDKRGYLVFNRAVNDAPQSTILLTNWANSPIKERN
jgi:hypothetical protein